MVVFSMIHFGYIELLVLSIIPNNPISSAYCSNKLVYPYMLIASNCLFVFAYLLSLVIHCCGYCVTWKIQKRSNVNNLDDVETELTIEEKTELKKKTLF